MAALMWLADRSEGAMNKYAMLAAAVVVGTGLLFFLSAPSDRVSTSTSEPPAVDGGTYKTRVLVVFDERTNAVVRKSYTVFDPAPEKNLEFEWIAERPSAGDAALVSGEGLLIWREAGKPSYDERAVISRYRGGMKEGRAHGFGELRGLDGLKYEGAWSRGLYDGQGALQLPDGTSYEGAFKAGKFDGEGTLIASDNEAFTGPFVGGLRHGRGKTRLPSGASYQSEWTSGVEDADSRQVRIAQGGPFVPMQFAPDDVRFTFQVDIWPPRVMNYGSLNSPERFNILPDSKGVNSALEGRGSISDDFMGYSSFGLSFWPVPLNVAIRNTSANRVSVSKAYLEVEDSLGELQPMYATYYKPRFGCPNDYLDTRVLFTNYGWRNPESMRFQLAFSNNPTATLGDGSRIVSAGVGTGARVTPLGTIVYDAEADLAALGVNMALLRQHASRVAGFILPETKMPGNEAQLAEALRTDGFDCQGLDDNGCLAKIAGSGMLGRLGPVAYMKDGVLRTTMVGTLNYPWTDAKGVRRTAAVRFNVEVFLGARRRICIGGELATGPTLDPGARTIVDLGVDKAAYRLAVPVNSIDAGQSATLSLLLRAPKSSRHRFRLVVETTDGHTIRSKGLSALFVLPSRDPVKFIDDPFEQRPNP
jgi:hypothetical protein